MINKNDIETFKKFLESDSQKAKITKVVLIAVALGTLPFIAAGGVAMGNAVQIFKKNKRYTKRQLSNAVTGLKKQRLIEFVSENNGVTTLRITKKGESKVKSFSIDMLSIKKPLKWDGKWRAFMFDLPIRYKQARNSLRIKLKQIGFIQLQKSVWIYPYPCEDELLYITDYYKIRNFIEILTIENIINDKKLKQHFRLA
ncbi:MAG: hypothetical protein KGI58_00950 [Patescibacteria group bacterium]|nr:hypothetical protein [Patescibacteria group bacterium]